MTYPDTWYARRTPDPGARPPLRGEIETEVAVIGAGLAGLTCALELAASGTPVVVLEAQRVGWGASGRNGGFVSPGYSAGHATIRRRVNEADALALHALSIEGAEMVREAIAAFSLPVDLHDGTTSVARYEAAAALARERDWLARHFNYQTEVWSRDQVRARLRSERYHQALAKPKGFHIDPLAYCRGLAGALEQRGGRVFEATPARSLERRDTRWRIATPEGVVSARQVVVATGGYTDRLVPRLRSAMLPIATYVMLSEAAPELIETAVAIDWGVGDQRRAGDYYRRVDQGRRLLWGGKITTAVAEPPRLAEALRRTMLETYPQLSPLRIETAWMGLMSYARHLMPLIGELDTGLWHCLGFGGHGLNTTAIGARVVAEAITGQSDRIRRFAPFSLDWNGGVLGRAAVQATYWWLQARDAWNER
jgi:gamma-glutamylputrescine oxidase